MTGSKILGLVGEAEMENCGGEAMMNSEAEVLYSLLNKAGVLCLQGQ